MIANFNSELILEVGAFDREIKKLSGSKVFLITSKTPYSLFKSSLKYLDYTKYLVKSNNLAEINNIVMSDIIDNFDVIIGFGSGTTIDFAKVVSFMKGKKLIAVPTILSSNVFATNKSVIVDKGKIKTISSKVPDKVIIDFKLIECTFERYSLIGLSDVLSIFTALFDWELAVKHKKEKDNLIIANLAKSLLYYIKKNYPIIFEKNSESLEKLATLLLLSGYLTNIYGSGRPESGSEHMFARALEECKVYRRKVLHGEAVLLGILLCSELQGQANKFVYEIAKKINLHDVLINIPLNEDIITDLLLRASKIRRKRYSIFNTIKINQDLARQIVQTVLYKLKNE